MKSKFPRRILLIVDYCHTGESLHVAAYLKAVRDSYPDARITLLANPGTRDSLASLEIFDRIIISRLYYDRPLRRFGAHVGKAWEFVRLVREVGLGYDLVVCFYWGTNLLRLLAYIVGRRDRVGHASAPTRLLTLRLPEFDRFGRSYAEQHRDVLHALGIDGPEISTPVIALTRRDQSKVERVLLDRGITDRDRIAVLHLGSDWACQQWSPEGWATLADTLAERHDLALIFTGTRAEAAYIEDVRRRMRGSASVTVAGETTLPELAALLSRAQICICVDSAVFDLTQVTGTPCVVLAGSTKPQVVPSRGTTTLTVNRMDGELANEINRCRGRHFIDGGCLNYACPMAGLREIRVEHVLAAVDQLLKTPADQRQELKLVRS